MKKTLLAIIAVFMCLFSIAAVNPVSAEAKVTAVAVGGITAKKTTTTTKRTTTTKKTTTTTTTTTTTKPSVSGSYPTQSGGSYGEGYGDTGTGLPDGADDPLQGAIAGGALGVPGFEEIMEKIYGEDYLPG